MPIRELDVEREEKRLAAVVCALPKTYPIRRFDPLQGCGKIA